MKANWRVASSRVVAEGLAAGAGHHVVVVLLLDARHAVHVVLVLLAFIYRPFHYSIHPTIISVLTVLGIGQVEDDVHQHPVPPVEGRRLAPLVAAAVVREEVAVVVLCNHR